MTTILTWILAVIAVEAVVEILTTSTLLNVPRAYILAQQNLLSELISCGWCTSVWVAASFGWALPGAITGYVVIDILVKTFALQRLANYLHEVRANWLLPQTQIILRRVKDE